MPQVHYSVQRTFINFEEEVEVVTRRRSKSWDGFLSFSSVSEQEESESVSKRTSSTVDELGSSPTSDDESTDAHSESSRSSSHGGASSSDQPTLCDFGGATAEKSPAMQTEAREQDLEPYDFFKHWSPPAAQDTSQTIYLSSGASGSSHENSQTMYCILPPIKVKLGPDGTPLWEEATTDDVLPTWVEAAPAPPAHRDSDSGVVASIPDHERTTIMLRNIPNDYTRDMLLELLDTQGFQCRYDFVYLPVDFRRWSGFGYAFVNFVTHADAERGRVYFHGFKQWKVRSVKVCDVCWGEPLQGLAAHIDRYRNSPLMHHMVPDHVRPALFMNGCRTEFPAPTKRIRHPRAKQNPARGLKCFKPVFNA